MIEAQLGSPGPLTDRWTDVIGGPDKIANEGSYIVHVHKNW